MPFRFADLTQMAKSKIAETDLYAPIKSFLEKQGYEVKAEVGAADIVAMRGDEEPIIVEMKIGFTLTLFHQATERLSLSQNVYIAAPRGKGRTFLTNLKNNKRLCRRLGLGLLSVRLSDGFVEAHLDPAPYKPRQSAPKKARLLREFEKRVGDPNVGGSTRQTIMTAYRQDAIRCLKVLSDLGPTKAALVAKAANVDRARSIMSADHYGWFQREEGLGVYSLTPKGKAAINDYADHILLVSAPSQ